MKKDRDFLVEDFVKVLPSHESYSELQGETFCVSAIGSSWMVLNSGKQSKTGQALELTTLKGEEVDYLFDAKDVERVNFSTTHDKFGGDETDLELYLDSRQARYQRKIQEIGLNIISCCMCDTLIICKSGEHSDDDIICHGCKGVINPNDCSDLNY